MHAYLNCSGCSWFVLGALVSVGRAGMDRGKPCGALATFVIVLSLAWHVQRFIVCVTCCKDTYQLLNIDRYQDCRKELRAFVHRVLAVYQLS